MQDRETTFYYQVMILLSSNPCVSLSYFLILPLPLQPSSVSFAQQAIQKVITNPNKLHELSKTCACYYPGHFTPVISPHGLVHADVLMSGFMDLSTLPCFLPLFHLWLCFYSPNSSGQGSPHSICGEQPKYLKKHSCVSQLGDHKVLLMKLECTDSDQVQIFQL